MNASFSWIVVSIYILVGALTLIKANRYPNGSSVYSFWIILTGVLFLLAIVRQFQLHDQLSNFGRHLSLQNGLYPIRRYLQLTTLLALLSTSIGMIIHWSRNYESDTSSGRSLVFIGTGLLLMIWTLRTVSYHYTDQIIHFDLGLISMSSILELSGLVAITFDIFKPSRPSLS
ncbi:MAG: hypothetical protein HOB84_15075 [Candidatus Marinimicrobia bacterium]|jgi:hypothetical protein|nr:hypothetical protein [Candidatus Neomarinimicrobiota bacterium]MBT4036368.1 hypothetical protein [Candidatus Neomarinimicrobiota bacterium]MBT4361257.1 hypothetical protein [Candidatus Neomarinimicrobiota bacterium]MBT4716090.1 hypothetical protein [Candidatus Neomarinimicrobiota bacterium]MBT4945222.1 hypothetical protein [Candidatus Neomarinimicrobiota bacterium]